MKSIKKKQMLSLVLESLLNKGGSMEKIEKLELAIQQLQRELEELKNKETPKRWRGKKGDDYYYISSLCHVEKSFETKVVPEVDERRYEIGNYFKTEEEAKQKLEYIKTEQQLKDIALRLNEGVEIDWEREKQWKYYIEYSFEDKMFTTDYWNTFKQQGTIYCLDKDFKDTAIAEIGEDNLIEYLKEC